MAELRTNSVITRSDDLDAIEFTREGSGGGAQQASGAKDEKAKALEYLKTVVAGWKLTDGQNRITMAEGSSNNVAAKNRWVALFHPNQVRRANTTLYENLKVLQQVEGSGGDKAEVNAILNDMQSSGVKVCDILKLNRLVQQMESDQQNVPADKHTTFDKIVDSARSLPLYSDGDKSDGPKFENAGQIVVAVFNRLRPELEEQQHVDGGTALGQFDAIITSLQKGDERPNIVKELMEVTQRGSDPLKYVQDELAKLNMMAERAGNNKSITWRDENADFKMTDRSLMTKEGRHKAGEKLADLLKPLTTVVKDDQFKGEVERLLEKIRTGEGKSTDIRTLYHLVEKAKTLPTQSK